MRRIMPKRLISMYFSLWRGCRNPPTQLYFSGESDTTGSNLDQLLTDTSPTGNCLNSLAPSMGTTYIVFLKKKKIRYGEYSIRNQPSASGWPKCPRRRKPQQSILLVLGSSIRRASTSSSLQDIYIYISWI
jgi:hypothetical protein